MVWGTKILQNMLIILKIRFSLVLEILSNILTNRLSKAYIIIIQKYVKIFLLRFLCFLICVHRIRVWLDNSVYRARVERLEEQITARLDHDLDMYEVGLFEVLTWAPPDFIQLTLLTIYCN